VALAAGLALQVATGQWEVTAKLHLSQSTELPTPHLAAVVVRVELQRQLGLMVDQVEAALGVRHSEAVSPTHLRSQVSQHMPILERRELPANTVVEVVVQGEEEAPEMVEMELLFGEQH
jgi:hypothetical protein